MYSYTCQCELTNYNLHDAVTNANCLVEDPCMQAASQPVFCNSDRVIQYSRATPNENVASFRSRNFNNMMWERGLLLLVVSRHPPSVVISLNDKKTKQAGSKTANPTIAIDAPSTGAVASHPNRRHRHREPGKSSSIQAQ